MTTTRFRSLRDVAAVLASAPQADAAARAAAAARNAALTKPDGALGRLEELAIWCAGWRGDPRPRIERAQIVLFAGNHGVVAQGVSAYPAAVTAQMVANFAAGGAAINQLARTVDAELAVTSLELDRPTADFTEGPAMSEAEACAALSVGWDAVDAKTDVLALGEMGIGNTTAAAAIAAALYGGEAGDWVGRGASPDGATLAAKRDAVERALARHRAELAASFEELPLEALRRLGGRELAAIAGAALRARVERIPVLLDGFICCAAVAPLHAMHPEALAHAQAAHRSAETAHGRLLAQLGLTPLLDLGLRLGEGSGAALAIGVLRAALACHNGMATFEEAAVSGRDA